MVASSQILMSDISRQNRYEVGLNGQLTPTHTVGQAIEHYLDRMGIPDAGLRWSAFSRGVKLDNKVELSEIADQEVNAWTVMPEVSAGNG